jgi:hypothetical protein
MSWLVKKWGKGKYGLWTTISDGYLHEPKKLDKAELVDFIAESWREDVEEKIKKLRETFPEDWWDKDTMERLTKED